jgi:hypothetical protein
MVAFAACASDTGPKVSVGAADTTSTSSITGPSSSTSGPPTAGSTTTSKPATPTTTQETTPVPDRDGFAVDPSDYIDQQQLEQVAQAGTVELPTWLPSWAGSAKPAIIAAPPFAFKIAWDSGTDSTTGEQIRVAVSREAQKDDAPSWELPPQTVQGKARSYHTWYGDTCPPNDVVRDGPVLVWRADGNIYSITVQPWPGCSPSFSIQDAALVADSLVPCRANGDALECEAKPS